MRQSKLFGYPGLFIIIALSGCNGCRINSEMVAGAEPDPAKNGAYFSSLDNPIIQRVDILSKQRKEASGEESFESLIVSRSGATVNGMAFQDFNIFLDAHSTGLRGSTNNQHFIPVPDTKDGEEVHAESDHNTFRWTVNGIELGYDKTIVEAKHTNAWGITKPINTIPLELRLKPGTILVPVQVVRIIFRGDPESVVSKSYTAPSYKLFFDDFTPINSSFISEPGKPIRKANHEFQNPRPIAFTRPDNVWNACGIQFRLISVTDLIVDESKFVRAESCIDGRFPEMQANREAIRTRLAGVVRDDLPIIIAVERAAGNNCVNTVADVAGAGWATMSLSQSSNIPLLISHELGHILGLNDDKAKGAANPHLMRQDDVFQTNFIRSQDCEVARRGAAIYSQRFWGVPMSP